MANKIKYGLSNVYFAEATIAANGTATYETPVAIPGAVSITLDPEGESTPFYADNIIYYVSTANSGYTGSLEIARIPAEFRETILGDVKDAKDVYFEDADASAKPFALLFQFEGDETATKYVYYNVTASRTSINSETKGASIEPGTDTLDLTIGMVKNTTLNKNVVRSFVEDDQSQAYAGWFTAVYQSA